eukprot:4876551-Prymnesium_polylepis.1
MQRCSTGAMLATGARGGRKLHNRTYARGSSLCGERACRGESSRPHQRSGCAVSARWRHAQRRNDPVLARRACPVLQFPSTRFREHDFPQKKCLDAPTESATKARVYH